MRTLLQFYQHRPEWMHEFSTQCRAIFERNKLLSILGIILPIIMVALIASHNKNTVTASQNKRNEAILRQLNEINAVIHDVENNPRNTKQQQIVLQALEKDVSFVQKSLKDVAKSTDIHKVSDQIASIKDDVDSQLSDLKKSISTNHSNSQYLTTNDLPFHVLSVDVIAGQPYVSVDYASHIAPIGVGDLLAGWRVITVDYDTETAEFIKENDQHVKITLSGSAT